MEPKKKWLSTEGWSCAEAEKYADSLAREQGYQCDIIEHYMIFRFCPEGFLWMRWENGRIIGDCQTNVAGAGFHGAVIHFLELFAAKGRLRLTVEDTTGYYNHRDFGRLRQEYFYRWFRGLLEETVRRGSDRKEQLLCWPADYYVPEEHKGTVMTHIRRFSLDEIKRILNSGMFMGFARDFFIWNEEEKDSYYYRNCALVMMNQECYYMPSSRSQEDEAVNGKILWLIEKAWNMNHEIPLPKEEYFELCRLHSKEPAIQEEDISPLHLPEKIGCRRGLLYRSIGNLMFAVPGHYLYDGESKGNAERYYDGNEQGWHDYYICGVQTKAMADFQETSFQQREVRKVIEFSVMPGMGEKELHFGGAGKTIETEAEMKMGEAMGKIAVYSPKMRNGRNIYTVAAQIICGHQMTVISISTDIEKDQKMAVELIKKVRQITDIRNEE